MSNPTPDGNVSTPAPDVTTRVAVPADEVSVRRVLDGAMLQVPDDLTARLEHGHGVVAETDETVVGALVTRPAASGRRVDAVAVQRTRRGRGIGSALVERAIDGADGPLTARFDENVRPFYDALDFTVVRRPDDGFLGYRDDESGRDSEQKRSGESGRGATR